MECRATKSCLLLLMCVQLVTSSNIGATRQDITLSDDGGYGNILIAIHEYVPEDLNILTNLQKYFTEASQFLTEATNEQMYFQNLTIHVPNTWSLNRSWETSKEGLFEKARILVARPNQAWGNTPYTLQPGWCGEEGDYIHLTPLYLLYQEVRGDSKPEKRLVREFAHLKWGLYDEDVSERDTVSKHFYASDGTLEATRCATDELYGLKYDTATESNCTFITGKQTYSPTCRYYPSEEMTKATASIMYAEHLNSVNSFCSQENHNKEAPNRQNRMCKGQSSWEVMNQLPDFADDHRQKRDGAAPPPPMFRILQAPGAVEATFPTTAAEHEEKNTTTNSAPTTTTADVTQTKLVCPQDIVCLLLDVSGSMSTEDRISKMHSAVSTYLLGPYLKVGSAVGIVSFESQPHILADMTVIESDADRRMLVSALPENAAGGTGIGRGLQACKLQFAEYAGSDIGNTRIVLLSDGKESGSYPMVKHVLPEMENLNITIDTILYSQAADNVLLNVSTRTGGESFVADDNNNNTKTDLNQYLTQTVQGGCKQEITSVANKLVNLSPADTSFNGSVDLDSTIGYNTTILFSYSGDINVEVVSRKGNNVTISTNEESKLIQAEVHGDASNDTIDYVITSANSAVPSDVVVTVVSNPVPGVEPIRIYTRVNSKDIKFDKDTKLNIYTDVFQGLTPVIGLTIYVTVKTGSGEVKRLPSLDRGTGMDSTPDDGVYTASFNAHEFKGNGFYSIQVDVEGNGLSPRQPPTREKRCVDCGDLSLGKIVRTKSAGVVNVANYFEVPDQTPPERIKDLSVVSVENSIRGETVFTLSWTAPGDDLNVGRVANYKLYVSNDSNLENLQLIPTDHTCIRTNLTTLIVEAGVTLLLKLDAENLDVGDLANSSLSTYFIRMITEDELGNVADYSNPVAITVVDPKRHSSAELTTTTTTTTSTTTTTTASTTTTTTAATTTTATSFATEMKGTNPGLVIGVIIAVCVGLVLLIAVLVMVVLKLNSRNKARKYHLYTAVKHVEAVGHVEAVEHVEANITAL